jgi:LmbE family N-acetylglucosaminyl deacetylase
MKLFLSPHPDDEALFGLDIIKEYKPLVVIITHPTLQGDNGGQRLIESYTAMRKLGVSTCLLGIDEQELNRDNLIDKLKYFYTTDTIYIPEVEGGHKQHDLVSSVASEIFPNIVYYKTYNKDGITGNRVFNRDILDCYQTQINNKETKHYFYDMDSGCDV